MEALLLFRKVWELERAAITMKITMKITMEITMKITMEITMNINMAIIRIQSLNKIIHVAPSMCEPCNQTDQCCGDRRGYLANCDNSNQAIYPQHQDWKRGQLW